MTNLKRRTIKTKQEEQTTDNSTVYEKAHRRVVAHDTGGCDHCPAHDKENRRKRPRPDKYKDKK